MRAFPHTIDAFAFMIPLRASGLLLSGSRSHRGKYPARGKKNVYEGWRRRSMKLVWNLACAVFVTAISGAVQAAEQGTDSVMVRRAIHVCGACHGEDGNSNVAIYPRLAGQQQRYIVAQLKAFRDQKRQETDPQAYMWGISALLDDATIEGLAEYYASQTPTKNKSGKASLVKKGKEIYEIGIPEKGVRACAACHGDNAEGAEVFPRLAGQHANYVFNQMQIFRTRLRPHGVVMTKMTKDLSVEEMRAVAEYVQSK